jgi:hypothetical protein
VLTEALNDGAFDCLARLTPIYQVIEALPDFIAAALPQIVTDDHKYIAENWGEGRPFSGVMSKFSRRYKSTKKQVEEVEPSSEDEREEGESKQGRGRPKLRPQSHQDPDALLLALRNAVNKSFNTNQPTQFDVILVDASTTPFRLTECWASFATSLTPKRGRVLGWI